MSARSGDSEAVLLPDLRGSPAELGERGVGVGGRRADVGVQLDDGGEELGLEPPRQLPLLRLADQQLDRGRERQRLGVENHHFLLDPNRKWRTLPKVLLDHGGRLNVFQHA